MLKIHAFTAVRTAVENRRRQSQLVRLPGVPGTNVRVLVTNVLRLMMQVSTYRVSTRTL